MSSGNSPEYPGAGPVGRTGTTEAAGGTTTEPAGQSTGAAKDEARHVASTAQSEAQNLTAQGRDQARALMEETKTQLRGQSREQRDRLAETLRSFSGELDSMAEQGSGMAADLARQVADAARRFGERIQEREPAEMVDDVREFARRRPGAFLLGALVSGVVVGRLARGAKDASSRGPDAQGTTPSDMETPIGTGPTATIPEQTRGTSTGEPLSGVGTPAGAVPPGGQSVGTSGQVRP